MLKGQRLVTMKQLYHKQNYPVWIQNRNLSYLIKDFPVWIPAFTELSNFFPITPLTSPSELETIDANDIAENINILFKKFFNLWEKYPTQSQQIKLTLKNQPVESITAIHLKNTSYH